MNNEIYVQNDGVAMGSPLGLILANVFTVELENTLVPRKHIGSQIASTFQEMETLFR